MQKCIVFFLFPKISYLYQINMIRKDDKNMRKAQLKIIEKAKRFNFKDEYIEFLSKLECKISDIEYIFDYIRLCSKFQSEENIIKEIEKYIYNDEFQLYLYYRSEDGDALIGDSYKKDIFVEHVKKILQIYDEISYRQYYYSLKIIYAAVVNDEDSVEFIADLFLNVDKFGKIEKMLNEEMIDDLIKNTSESIIAKVLDCNDDKINSIVEFMNSWTYKYAENKSKLIKYIIDNNIKSSYDLLDSKRRDVIFKFKSSLEELNNTAVKGKYRSYLFKDEDRKKLEKYCACMKSLNCSGDINIKHFTISVHESEGFDKYINIQFSIYKNTSVNSDGVVNGSPKTYEKNIAIVIYPNGNIMEKKNSKTYPLTVKSLRKSEEIFFIGCLLLNCMYEEGYYFAKDVLEDVSNDGCVVPININDIFLFHSKKEYIEMKYPLRQNIKINRLNLNKAYLLNKAKKYVEPDSLGYLYNCMQKKDGLHYSCNLESVITNVLSSVIEERVKKNITQTDNMGYETITLGEQEVKDELPGLTFDYVRMCIHSKRKVCLRIDSLNQLQNIHDFTNRNSNIENTRKVEVPKNSVFNELRKILPKEYEWIKTRKRLMEEAKIQHHCVWSYADKITKDKCAIYSYYDKDCEYGDTAKRYTIEFMYQNGKYEIKQVQGRYDAVNSTDMKTHIMQLLNK